MHAANPSSHVHLSTGINPYAYGAMGIGLAIGLSVVGAAWSVDSWTRVLGGEFVIDSVER